MYTAGLCFDCQARDGVWLNFPRSKLYQNVMNQNSKLHSGLHYHYENQFSFTIVGLRRLTDIPLWYLNFAMSELPLEPRLCFSFESLRKGKRVTDTLSGVTIKISWKLISGMKHCISKILVKILFTYYLCDSYWVPNNFMLFQVDF